MERLDKVLCDASVGSRKDCARLIRQARVRIDGVVVKAADAKVGAESEILVDGEPVVRLRRTVCIMNKGAGLVTSTDDDRSPTVMTKLPEAMFRQRVVPAGRLDKDTEGLLVFTNDGDLLHRLISPKHEVSKVYYVEHEGTVGPAEIEMAEKGLVLKDGTVCRSAVLVPLGEGRSLIRISEGMYHQVKRMFGCLKLHLTYLKRVQIGSLSLYSDKFRNLGTNGVVELSEEEIRMLLDSEAAVVMPEGLNKVPL